MSITGGTVSFEQSRKLAEYENRKVQISFNVTDETDATQETSTAAALAQSLVFNLLGLTGTGAKTITPEQIAASAAATKVGKVSHKKKPAEAAQAADPAAMETTEDKPAISTGEARTAPDDIADVGAPALDPFTAEITVVTDKMLNDAIQRKNDELVKAARAAGKDGSEGTKKIRQLNARYVPPPEQYVKMPAEARPKYLEELAALTL